MARYLLHVYSKPHPGQEAAYHAWYDNTHLGDVIALPGFIAAARYIAQPLTADGSPSGEFLAVYEMETENPHADLAGLNAAAAGMDISPALDFAAVRMELHKLLTPRLEKTA